MSLTSLTRGIRHGIGRADIQWSTVAVQNTVIDALRRFPFQYYRGPIRAASLAAATAALFRRIQDVGCRPIILTSLIDEDFTNGDADKVNDRFPVSGFDATLVEARLDTYCAALVAAGVLPAAFQLLNEIDMQNFNGDIPLSGLVEDIDLGPFVSAYDNYVGLVVPVIETYYPDVPIISFGAANFRGQLTDAAIRNPGVLLSLMTNLNLLSGIAVHIYPSVNDDIADVVSSRLNKWVDDSGSDLPVWITEWGSLNSQYPDGNGRTRLQMFQQTYNAVVASEADVSAMIAFSLDDFGNKTMVDEDYDPLPEAAFFFGIEQEEPSDFVPSMDFSDSRNSGYVAAIGA